jgi:Flp pilus assembly protein TadD
MSLFLDSSIRFSIAALIVLAAATTSLAGCEDMIDITGSIAAPAKAMPTNDGNLRAKADEWGKRYDSDPGEKSASINYARVLRAQTRYQEAAEVMQKAAVRSPHDSEVLGAYGKALADWGQLIQAKDVLTRAYTPDRPNPTIMAVQGAVDDELGDHEGARTFYRAALKIAPGDPAVLNNLALSYLLTKQLPQAEAALREANASPQADTRERNNLALVLAIEGKFADARKVNRAEVPAKAATADALAPSRTLAHSVESSPGGPTSPLAYSSN